ncbi:MAG: hypothetical protein WBG02_20060 [Candidatus Acidiferrum sp.]
MKITAGQDPTTPPVSQGTSANPPKNSGVATQTQATQKAPAAPADSAATELQHQTNVTLRRDTNGRVYYVVSDAKSGQEILEVPPKELRDVGQGIEDYLKQQQSKASSHVEVKA